MAPLNLELASIRSSGLDRAYGGYFGCPLGKAISSTDMPLSWGSMSLGSTRFFNTLFVRQAVVDRRDGHPSDMTKLLARNLSSFGASLIGLRRPYLLYGISSSWRDISDLSISNPCDPPLDSVLPLVRLSASCCRRAFSAVSLAFRSVVMAGSCHGTLACPSALLKQYISDVSAICLVFLLL